MFGRLKLYLFMMAFFAAFAGVAYWYYQDTQKAMRQYAENQAKLETALSTQTAAFEQLQRDMALLQETQQKLQEDFIRSRELTKSLETLFKEGTEANPKDFNTLAAEQSELVTEELNRGTREVFECFEQLSGNGSNNGGKKYIDCFSTD
jgi:septal ring factor EnvC (AmiA/AmiB activator)